MSKEQRKYKRFPTTIVTELHTPDSVISKGKGCVTDLSLGGMGFETEANFDEDTDIFLTFNLPIEVQGKIVHIKKAGALKRLKWSPKTGQVIKVRYLRCLSL